MKANTIHEVVLKNSCVGFIGSYRRYLSQKRSAILFPIFFSFVLIPGGELHSQNIGINTTGAAPDAAAMLDIVSSTKGLLIPRVALTAANSNVPVGAGIVNSLLVFNTATAGVSPNNVVPGY